MSNTCKKCFSHYCTPENRCKKFTVIDEDLEEHEYYALHPEDAARTFAEYFNEEGSLMYNEENITVNGKKFCVSAQPSVEYSITEIED